MKLKFKKRIYIVFALGLLAACGGIESEEGDLAMSEDAVTYKGVDGSTQTCSDCTCGTDALGNCVVYNAQGQYHAMCSSCSAITTGGVSWTPAPTLSGSLPRSR